MERGLIAPDAHLTEGQIQNLIFEPGFSTAERVTDVSGRGVGMDVVKQCIQRLRGKIEIRSVLGKGTTFSFKLPLTLAILEGLVVRVAQERYIVPLFTVKEMFRPAPEMLFTVENKAELVLFRDQLLPITRLARRFGLTGAQEDPSNGLLIVVESHERSWCLMVDGLIGKQEVVIKSLGDFFKQVGGLAGGAILGDGRVGLILDVDALSGEIANG
jgi:two-component system, chemotaxis family, sensor kinase CheA